MISSNSWNLIANRKQIVSEVRFRTVVSAAGSTSGSSGEGSPIGRNCLIYALGWRLRLFGLANMVTPLAGSFVR